MAAPSATRRTQTSFYKIIFGVLLVKLLAMGTLLLLELQQAISQNAGTFMGGSAKNGIIIFATGIFLCAVLVLIITYYYISKNHRKLEKLNNDLTILNQSFRNAEILSEMGHWRRHMSEPDNIHYSDNMYRLLGLEPEEVPFNELKLMSYVHPDDHQRLEQVLSGVRERHEEPMVNYRIIRRDGITRHLHTAGKFLCIDGQPILLGATRDVTEEMENNLAIESKNRALENMVEELASFNHIASHDLQNPLRKIQMFISRIQATEPDLSEEGRDYFDRIAAAAAQMEQLIDDLLLYSETGNSEKAFEECSLNDLLEEAKGELSAEITISNAEITNTPLPNLAVIPFQVRQLFVNLIGNAIKYSKAGIAPAIQISCDASAHPGDENRHFQRISIKDNGIGFKQEDSSRIFVLFRRLHKKGAYEGTGIGLSICKKIMENHGGYITAESAPGAGAVFHLYFPVKQQTVL